MSIVKDFTRINSMCITFSSEAGMFLNNDSWSGKNSSKMTFLEGILELLKFIQTNCL